MWTEIIFSAPANAACPPVGPFTRKLCGHVGVAEIFGVTGYPYPNRWDIDWEVMPQPSLRLERVPPSQLEHAIGSCDWTSLSVDLNSDKWGKRLADALRSVPESILGGCLPWDIIIRFGPTSIPDLKNERTVAETNLAVMLCGDGWPSQAGKFFQLVMETDPVKELKKFLEDTLRYPFAAHLSCDW